MSTSSAGEPRRQHTAASDQPETDRQADSHTGNTTDRLVLVRRVNQLYARAPIGMAATGLNAVLVTVVLWDQMDSMVAAAWLGCQLASVSIRYLAYLRFCRAQVSEASEVPKWLLRIRLGALVSGVVWGSSAILLYPHGSLPHQIFLAFVLGGMVAGASGVFALDLKAFAAYCVPSVAPVTLQLLAGGERLHLAMGSMMFLFAVLMSWLARQNNRSILASLRLGAEKENLVASLELARDQAERLNRDLSEEVLERERAEQELRDHRDHLEDLVEARAKGLAAANMQLLEVITERERARQQASRIAREWVSTFDNMLDQVAVIGPDLKITRANAPLARSVSTHPRELIGKSCHEVFRDFMDLGSDCPHRQVLQSGATVTRQFHDLRNGTPFLLTCSPFTDGDGELIGIVHVARDISEQERAERKREELLAQLQQAVSNVKLLSGLLPICSSCKKIRDDEGYWTQIEKYIREHSEAEFTHGICPECAAELYPEYSEKRAKSS